MQHSTKHTLSSNQRPKPRTHIDGIEVNESEHVKAMGHTKIRLKQIAMASGPNKFETWPNAAPPYQNKKNEHGSFNGKHIAGELTNLNNEWKGHRLLFSSQ